MKVGIRNEMWHRYTVSFYREGKRVRRNLKVPRDPRFVKNEGEITPGERRSKAYQLAEREAHQLYVAFEEELAARVAERKRPATVGELVDAFEDWSAERERAGLVSAVHWQGVLSAWWRLYREVEGEPVTRGERAERREVVQARLGGRRLPEVLGAELVERYFLAAMQRMKGAKAGALNSTVKKARQLFSRPARDYYRRVGVNVPVEGLQAFLDVPVLKEGDKRFKGLDPAKVRAMEEAAFSALESGVHEEVQIGLCYLLQRYFALRTQDVLQVRWGWFESTARGKVLVLARREDYHPKTEGALPVAAEVWERLRQFEGAPRACVVWPELEPRRLGSAAGNRVYRVYSQWVRQWFPETFHTGYLLRKHTASEVLTETDSVEAAAALLRNSPEVLRQRYALFLGETPSVSFGGKVSRK